MKLWLLPATVLFSAALFAQPVQLTDSSGVISAGRHLDLFEDVTGRLTIEDVRAPDFKGFKRSKSVITNYNITRSTVWCRLTLINRSHSDKWFLECNNPNVNTVSLYLSHHDTARRVSGFSVLPDNREIGIHRILFPLTLPRDTAVTCFFSLRDVLPLQIHFSVASAGNLFEKYEAEDFLHGAFFGLMFMLVIYNLFIYIPVRDKVYLFYVIFVIANAWFISFLTGYGIHVPIMARVLQSHPALVPFLLGCASVLFSIVFLDMKRTFPTGYRITVVMFFLLFPVAVLDLAGLKTESIILVQLLGLIYAVISFVFGWIIYRRGYTSAKFYIVGWTAYLIGLTLHISTDLTLIPFNAFTHNSLEIFTATEAILLSMAVGDKINVFKTEKETAQKQSLATAMENERLVREQNITLAAKVKERTQELEEQKHLVEEKNKEILDSINYAQRIQRSLLAHADVLTDNLPSHFVYFNPKDIVSGDFYWAAATDGGFYLAVCDSTGHGVPGAFMSLLNISYLNEAVIEKRIGPPGAILDHVRNRLIENLSKYGGQDGMDGVLLRIGKEGTITYAAANNSVVVIRNGECIEFPPDKMPIGIGEKMQPFSARTIDARSGDMIYLFTDGFADQFGGPLGKKFKYKQLNDLFIAIASLEPADQKSKLEAAFEAWQGSLEQVDDVCVIGIRVHV